MKLIYLAGPDVFLPDAIAQGERKKSLCEKYGFIGLYPFDSNISLDDPNASSLIYKSNVSMIKRCHAIICNLTPFRSVSADVGTAFELGYASAMGKMCLGYSNDGRPFEARHELPDEMFVESFGNHDNLMIDEAIKMCSDFHVRTKIPEEESLLDVFRNLDMFERCLIDARAHYQQEAGLSLSRSAIRSR